MRIRTSWLSGAATALLLSLSPLAHAQEAEAEAAPVSAPSGDDPSGIHLSPEVEGRVRLSLEGVAFSYASVKATPDSAADGPKTESSTTQAAVLSSGLGFGVSYGLSRRVIFGARLFVQNTSQGLTTGGVKGATVAATQYALYPELLYVAPTGARVRPFIGPTLGVSGLSTDAQGSKVSSVSFDYGILAGLHAFLTPSFSLDPAVRLLGSTGSQDVTLPTGGSAKLSSSGITFLVSLGFSGWLGGRREPASEAAAGAAGGSGLPEPRRAPVPNSGTLAEDATRFELDLISGDHLQLVAFPERDRYQVVFYLSGPNVSPAVAACRAPLIVAGSRRVPLERVPAGGGSTLTLTTSRQAAFALSGDEDDSWIEACDTRFALNAAHRLAVRRYLVRQFPGVRGKEDATLPAPEATPPEAAPPSDAWKGADDVTVGGALPPRR